jgi:two-component system sensor histidine kinase ComP
MQERVQAFNGQFSINTDVGEGMSIRIKVIEGNHTHSMATKDGQLLVKNNI